MADFPFTFLKNEELSHSAMPRFLSHFHMLLSSTIRLREEKKGGEKKREGKAGAGAIAFE